MSDPQCPSDPNLDPLISPIFPFNEMNVPFTLDLSIRIGMFYSCCDNILREFRVWKIGK